MKRRHGQTFVADVDPLERATAHVTTIAGVLPPRKGIRLCLTVAQALAKQAGLHVLEADIGSVVYRLTELESRELAPPG